MKPLETQQHIAWLVFSEITSDSHLLDLEVHMKRLITRFFECGNSLLARKDVRISPVILMQALTTLIVAHSMSVYATNVFSAASGDWGNPATWSTGLIPGSSDNVFIGSGHTVTVDVGVACADLHVGRNTSIPNGGIIIFGPGSLHVLGDIIVGVPSFGAGIVSMAQGELLLEGSLTIPNGVFIATGGAVWYEGVASQTVASLSYHDLILRNGPKIAGGPITVEGDLTMYTVNVSFDASSFTHHVKGDWLNEGFFDGGTSTIILDGIPTQNISGSNVFHHLILDGGDHILNDSTTITGDLTINAGVNFVPNSPVNFTVDGDWTNNGTFLHNGGTVYLGGNLTQRIDNNNSSGSFYNLILKGTGTKEAYSDLIVNGDFTIRAASTYHVQPAFDTHLKGGVTVNGTLDLGNTTVWFEGTGPQNIPGGQTYGTLRLVGSTKTATGALTINGHLIVAADAIFNPGSYNHDLGGNLNNDGTVHAGTGLITFDGTGTQFIRGSGSTTFNSVGFINSLKTAEASFTVNDLFYIDGSASFDAGSNTITVKGDWNGGSTRFIPGTSTIILNSPSPQSIGGSPTFKNLTLTGAGIKTANTSITVDSTFTINSAATFSSGSVTHHINGDWIKNGTFLANAGAIDFSGIHPQLITGAFRFNNVTVDNDSGVRLAATLGDSIEGTLTFANGRMNLGTTDLTLEPSATVTGAAEGKCIITNGTGRLRRTIQGGASAEIFTFPIAPNKTSYNPLAIGLRPDVSEPTETFTARVEEFTNASPGFGVTDTSYCTWRIWTIEEETVGGNRTNLAFQWDPDEDGTNIGISPPDPVQAMAYLYVNGTGQYEAVDDAVGPPHLNNPIIAATLGYTTMSFGSYIVGNAIALPVQLVSFTGVEIPNIGVHLDWRTLSEVNNYGFYVQRKREADSAWTELSNSFRPGYGTTNEPHDYSFVDSAVAGGQWLYRLRQVDLNSTSHYSEAITVSIITSVDEHQLPTEFALRQNYPNPFNPTTIISFDLPSAGDVMLKVYDMLGREVATLVNEARPAGRYTERFDATGLASGVYLYRLTSPSHSATKKLVLLR